MKSKYMIAAQEKTGEVKLICNDSTKTTLYIDEFAARECIQFLLKYRPDRKYCILQVTPLEYYEV